MPKTAEGMIGTPRIVKRYRAIFRMPENTRHYSEADFKLAERRFIKYALSTGLGEDGLHPAPSPS